MLADLHTHSSASDGQLTPHELLQQAADADIEILAITDHDTVAGVDTLTATKEIKTRLIPGVELSANWSNVCIHVLGLAIDTRAAELRSGLQRQQSIRTERAGQIAAKLERAGFHGVCNNVRPQPGSEYIGRPDFARYLVDSGQLKDARTAFKKYLGRGKMGDVRHSWPALEETVTWIKAAGGIAALAHPAKYKLSNLRLEELCKQFVQCGGRALEVVSGAQDPNLTDRLAGLARRHNLYASCGSDFHAPGQPWAELGRVQPLPAGCRPIWELW